MNFDDTNFNIKSYFTQTDDSTGNARSCTTCLQGLISATFSKIILKEVNYTASPNDGEGAHQVNLVIEEIEPRSTILIRLNVSKIANVTVAGAWSSVMLTKRIIMRSETITTVLIVGKITKLVNVKSVLAVRSQSFNSSEYFGLGLSIFLSCLHEPHISGGIILG